MLRPEDAEGRVLRNCGKLGGFADGLVKKKENWPPVTPVFVKALYMVELMTRPKYMPYPPRTAVLPSPKTSHAKPMRGPRLLVSLGMCWVCGTAGLGRMTLGSISYS